MKSVLTYHYSLHVFPIFHHVNMSYLFYLIIAIIAFSLCGLYTKRIREAKSAKDAAQARRNLRRTKKIFFHEEEDAPPISDETKESYLSKHERFALYLRAFHNDKYGEESKFLFAGPTQDEFEDFNRFSEQFFMKELTYHIPTCAIGMKYEIESPKGASRVYVDDDTWQEDVKEMMERATIIFILLDDRDSCVWEFEQSLEMREKTIYIVDDVALCEKISDKTSLSLPQIPDYYAEFQHFIFLWQNDRFFMQPFENTQHDYRQLVYFLIGGKIENEREEAMKTLYGGLGRIWVSDADSTDTIRQQLSHHIETKQQCCPITFFDTITLVDCKFTDNQIIFSFNTDETDEEQLEQLFFALCDNELELTENHVFRQLARHLNIGICHRYTNPSNEKTFEFNYQP